MPNTYEFRNKWSGEATGTFDAIVLFIEYKWSVKEAGKFIKRTQKILSLIPENPKMYKSSIDEKVRQEFITVQVSMYYEIHETFVTLLFFWDNRQEPIL